MKLGDLVKNIMPEAGHGDIGMVMEEEEYNGERGTWVEYFADRYTWRWYSFDERYNVEVINECNGT